MINPNEITNYDRTKNELEEFLLFAIIVAGKNSEQQAKKIDRFLRCDGCPDCPYVCASPFATIRIRIEPFSHRTWRVTNDRMLRKVKMGQYGRIGKAFEVLAESKIDLATCTVADLEAIPGIGPKTARFFLLHTRRDARIAVLDTHILTWLRGLGYETPATTPQNANTYATFEKAFIRQADMIGVSVAELDLHVWKTQREAA